MSDFELPDQYSPSNNPNDLTIWNYSDHFSADWHSDISYQDFLSKIDSTFEIDPESEAVLQTESFSDDDISYSDVIDKTPQDPVLFTVYFDDHSVSWKMDDSDSLPEIGFASISTAQEPFFDIYEKTADSIDAGTRDEIDEFFEDYVER
jgi:hypothetical protein